MFVFNFYYTFGHVLFKDSKQQCLILSSLKPYTFIIIMQIKSSPEPHLQTKTELKGAKEKNVKWKQENVFMFHTFWHDPMLQAILDKWCLVMIHAMKTKVVWQPSFLISNPCNTQLDYSKGNASRILIIFSRMIEWSITARNANSRTLSAPLRNTCAQKGSYALY